MDLVCVLPSLLEYPPEDLCALLHRLAPRRLPRGHPHPLQPWLQVGELGEVEQARRLQGREGDGQGEVRQGGVGGARREAGLPIVVLEEIKIYIFCGNETAQRESICTTKGQDLCNTKQTACGTGLKFEYRHVV